MKKFVKFASVLCAAMMLVGAGAGCGGEGGGPGGGGPGGGAGGGSSGSSGKQWTYKGKDIMTNLGSATGTVKFMVGGGETELALWDELISAFETANPGINVEPVSINDMDTLYTQLMSGSAPDVIQVESPNFGNWAKNGALQSLQPLVARDSYDTSDYWSQLIEMFSFDTQAGVRGTGDLFALPKDMGVYGVFVNRDIVNAAKNAGKLSASEYAKVTDQVNPMTYGEYLTIAKKLTTVDTANSANTVFGTNRVYWESYLWSLGDDILTSEYQLNTMSTSFKQVMEYSKSMVTKTDANYCAPYTPASSTGSTDEESLFLTGKIAMYWGGRWRVPAYDAANMNYYAIPLPVAEKADGTKGESIGWCSTVGYAVSRNSTKGEMAWKLIKFLTSQEGYRVMNKLNYNVPGRKSLITESKFANPTTNGSKLDAASAAVFFKTAEKARINNACRFCSPNWIEQFENKLSLYFTNEIGTFEQLMQQSRGSVNAAIRQSDAQLFN